MWTFTKKSELNSKKKILKLIRSGFALALGIFARDFLVTIVRARKFILIVLVPTLPVRGQYILLPCILTNFKGKVIAKCLRLKKQAGS
ncbi:MAG: hypothetical protein A3E68_02485 [Candidatus Levybacteria bacterium RIFCSPHIGHO2_12_FULL_39_39]|nr:MAG: hypothetical protein A3E68_02485 [Candidatus Levybacteria bacterium RIFCSPHIGHO2_12_FULL_39_39]OGH45127.1 MAG: hypothetical protein A3H82_01175 [Candidatus Levybacteria bacterium RIFCSPLOWO2_02_FULL_39_26]OGH47296.1 MAG: hypothetical protein A3G66_03590 [Candidatus Levybacteria bacterium RIFCSPLOWO2_12_FULL_39_17]